jgi:hypothetical protein
VLTILLVAVGVSERARAATISFGSVAPGTILGTQFQAQGINFVPHRGFVGIVQDHGGRRVGIFNQATASCEFCPTGMRAIFAGRHGTVRATVALLGNTPTTFVLRGFNAAGQRVAEGITWIVPGVTGEVVISSPARDVVAVNLEPVGGGEAAPVALVELTYEDAGSSAPADFSLEVPSAWVLDEGGPSERVPIVLRRYGGSTGGIVLSVQGLPAGVMGAPTPTVTTGSAADLPLTAAAGTGGVMARVTVTATPVDATAGPTARSAGIDLFVQPRLEVQGPARVDAGSCKPTSVAGAEVTARYLVWRAPSLAAGAPVSIDGLPPNVQADVQPSQLTFPGGALAEAVTVRLRMLSGQVVPDTTISLHVGGETFDVRLFGTCPRQQKNFEMRGRIVCVYQMLEIPLPSAEVRLLRQGYAGIDQELDVILTDQDGRFRFEIATDQVATYYARPALYDRNRVWLTSAAAGSRLWWQPLDLMTNDRPLLDYGDVYFARSDGARIPECVPWNGARFGYYDVKATTGYDHPHPTMEVIVSAAYQAPFALQGTINWPDNYVPGFPADPMTAGPPSAVIDNARYQSLLHEMGHTIRHTLDGEHRHFLEDVWRFGYARKHTACSVAEGTITNAGYAFNEGWADFWANRNQPICAGDEWNFEWQGNVARDLVRLAKCMGVGRKGMFEVLKWHPANHGVTGTPPLFHSFGGIHTQDEFRHKFRIYFPDCPVTTGSPGCTVGQEIERPLTAEPPRDVPPDPRVAEASLLAALGRLSLLRQELRNRLDATQDGQERALLEARLRSLDLHETWLAEEFDVLRMGTPPAKRLSDDFHRVRRRRGEEALRAIARAAVDAALRRASPRDSAADPHRTDLERTLAGLTSKLRDDSLWSWLAFDPLPGGYVSRVAPAPPQEAKPVVRWMTLLKIAALTLTLMLLLLLLLVWRRWRPRAS